MAKKVISPIDIDFETGDCSETEDSLLSFSLNRINRLPNPYVGNKRKILGEIVKFLNEQNIEYDTVLDLFMGSGCFSILMKLLGKRVFYNDILHSSLAYGNAFVGTNDPLPRNQVEYVLNTQPTEVDDFVQKNFADRFTKNEAIALDRIRTNASQPHVTYSAAIMANVLLYIMDHCFVGGRLNSGQVLARLDHRLAHQRNGGKEMSFKDITWYEFVEPRNTNEHKYFLQDAVKLLGMLGQNDQEVSLCYIDPPYGGQQSDYSKMFEFFECYVRHKMPQEWLTEDHVKFAKTKGYEDHFRQLLSAAKWVPTLLISYNDDSWADLETLKGLVGEQREYVCVKTIDYHYKYRDEDNKKGKEYLILAR